MKGKWSTAQIYGSLALKGGFGGCCLLPHFNIKTDIQTRPITD